MMEATEDAVRERLTRLERAMRPIAMHRDAPGCGYGSGHTHWGTAHQDPTNGGGSASPPLQAGGPHAEPAGFPHARHGGPGRLLVGQPGEVGAGAARDRARHPREGEGTLNTPEIRGLGIVQDGFTGRWKATGELEGVGWLEAWGSALMIPA
jgi:hypothetical protein